MKLIRCTSFFKSHGSKLAMTVNPPKTSDGIEQLDDTLDDFFSHELLNTLLPGIFLFILI